MDTGCSSRSFSYCWCYDWYYASYTNMCFITYAHICEDLRLTNMSAPVFSSLFYGLTYSVVSLLVGCRSLMKHAGGVYDHIEYNRAPPSYFSPSLL